MHTFTSSVMVDEVSALAEEYAIPSDLRPKVSPLILTMNKLLVGAIGIYEQYLEMPGIKNVIDLRPVHPWMLYEIGLTTIWKHVGHHPKFKDGEGNVAASMSEFLKFPIASGARIGRGIDVQDKAAGKRPGRAGTFGHTKKRKTIPLRMALSESKADGSLQDGSRTVHSTTPLNTFNPANTDAEDGGINSPHSASSPHSEHSLHFEEHTKVRTSEEHLNKGDNNVQHAATCTEVFVSTSGGFGRRIFPGRHSGGDEGVNLRTHLSPPNPFVPS
ncbi:hypothetical protein Tco_1268860 [Tanacetum coccineum]